MIHAYHLPPTLRLPSNNEIKSGGTLKSSQSDGTGYDYRCLKHSKGNVTAAAHEIGITPRMVRYKIKKLNIDFEELFRRGVNGAIYT